MEAATGRRVVLLGFAFLIAVLQVWPDGGFFSSGESIAVSADQRAILVQDGGDVRMTLSTGYTGDGAEFGWVIPLPSVPEEGDVYEPENGQAAFRLLEEATAPETYVKTGGCFAAGTIVLTESGAVAIEAVIPGTRVHAYDHTEESWVLTRVAQNVERSYSGPLITIRTDRSTVNATESQPFFVTEGHELGSRPRPGEVSAAEWQSTSGGRWVAAGDLRAGDLLLANQGEGTRITGLSSRAVQTTVYNLVTNSPHNYAVTTAGILAHNKSGPEIKELYTEDGVTLFQSMTLEHYEVSVLGASDGTALIGWLDDNGYPVNQESSAVLDSYTSEGWSFVAVKLNPGQLRRHDNEFLAPLTITFASETVIFPLRISAVSSTEPVRLSLYVIAAGQAASGTHPVTVPRLDESLTFGVSPEEYVESRIIQSARGGENLVLLWSGPWNLSNRADDPDLFLTGRGGAVSTLRGRLRSGSHVWLTRLEGWVSPEQMTRDIRLHATDASEPFSIELAVGQDHSSVPSSPPEELVAACQLGDLRRVQEMLESGVSPLATAPDGTTAIARAVRGGHVDVARALVNAAPTTVPARIQLDQALVEAASIGDAEFMEVLVRWGADVDSVRLRNKSALEEATFYAAFHGGDRGMRFLLDAGANPRREARWGSPLNVAYGYGKPELVQYLLDAGATPRLYLCDRLCDEEGELAVMELVLAAGAYPNPILRPWGDYVTTPLLEAATAGRASVVRLLMQAGVDPNQSVDEGMTPLMLADAETAQVL